jgi:hypothetical protein
MSISNYNNFGIGAIALCSVLNHCKELSLTKVFLIFPLSSHQKLLQYFGRKTTQIMSVEKLIGDKVSYFSNFNKRYYDSLPITLNALQYLHNMEYLEVVGGSVFLIKPLIYDKKMGDRANKIFNASENIAQLLQTNSSSLYLNLRVEL